MLASVVGQSAADPQDATITAHTHTSHRLDAFAIFASPHRSHVTW
jgi:hypothetical protein